MSNPNQPSNVPLGEQVRATAQVQATAEAGELYQVSGIVLATFLSIAPVGLYLMYRNYKELGMRQEARSTFSMIWFALVLVIFLGPSEANILTPVFVLLSSGIQAVAVYFYAKRQIPLIDAHVRGGGLVASNWIAAGIGIAFTILIYIILMAIAMLSHYLLTGELAGWFPDLIPGS